MPLRTLAIAFAGLTGCGWLLASVGRAADPPAPAATDPAAAAAGNEFFETNIRPLLLTHCAKCHGETKPKGGLQLTSRAALLAGGDSGPAAVLDKPGESLLLQVLAYTGDIQMPPKGKLPESEIALFAKWVQLGLPWPDAASTEKSAAPADGGYKITPEQRNFWSFRPVKVDAPPAVADTGWPRSPIDRYILAKLEAAGLKPAPAADRRTLLRRVNYDLIGLPPTIAETRAFLADESPDAFAKVVDRLLASPRYGERWGRHWLDIVRYADSRDSRDFGGAADITEAWRYRDWVAAAFNRDLPYDQFVTQQLAGDIVTAAAADESGAANARADGLVATGLLTLGEWGTGDADKEKMLTDIVDDQINVVSRAFLGLTVACARCHDHKFDPIPTADYYSLAGIFYSTHILPDPGAKTNGSPMLRTPLLSPAEQERRQTAQAQLAKAQEKLKQAVDVEYQQAARSVVPRTGDYLLAAWDLAHPEPGQAPVEIEKLAADRGLAPGILRRCYDWLSGSDARLLSLPHRNFSGQPALVAWHGANELPCLTANTSDQVLAFTTIKMPARSISMHPGPKSPVAIRWRSPLQGEVRMVGRVSDADGNCGDGIRWTLQHRVGRQIRELATGTLGNGQSGNLAVVAAAPSADAITVELHEGDSLQLAVLPGGEYTCDTTVIDWEISEVDGQRRVWNLAADLIPDLLVDGHGNPHADRLGNAGVWSFVELGEQAAISFPEGTSLARLLTLLDADRDAPAAHADIAAAATAASTALAGSELSAADALLATKLTADGGLLAIQRREDHAELPPDARARLTAAMAEVAALKQLAEAPAPLALAAQEGGVPQSAYAGFHDARIQIRGSYTRLGDEVPRRFPRIIAGEDQPAITAGSGRRELAEWIVRKDNPLTARVIANRIWEYHFGQGLVRTPNNFGKLGERPTHPELLDYLANALVTGHWSIKQLHRAILLSAVYQQSSAVTPDDLSLDPDNRLWSRMNRRRLESEPIRDSLLSIAGRLDTTMGGPSIRDFNSPRRTMYLTTIRSDRSGFGSLFDAADPESSTDMRTVSTAAPQALFMMNHPFTIAQAAALAQRAQAAAPDASGRIRWLYETVYQRPAGDRELTLGRQLLARLRSAPQIARRATHHRRQPRQPMNWLRGRPIVRCCSVPTNFCMSIDRRSHHTMNLNHSDLLAGLRQFGGSQINRREALSRCGSGFGMLALAGLLAEKAQADGAAAASVPASPLAVRRRNFRRRLNG